MADGPRTVDGRRMHLLHSEGYAVLLDSLGGEISERVPGRLWIAPLEGTFQMIFDPDSLTEVATTSMVVTKRSRGFSFLGRFIGDDLIHKEPTGHILRPGDTYHVDWQGGYAAMA